MQCIFWYNSLSRIPHGSLYWNYVQNAKVQSNKFTENFEIRKYHMIEENSVAFSVVRWLHICPGLKLEIGATKMQN